jgi:hypothetical protein
MSNDIEKWKNILLNKFLLSKFKENFLHWMHNQGHYKFLPSFNIYLDHFFPFFIFVNKRKDLFFQIL